MQKNCLGIKLYDAMSAGLRPYCYDMQKNLPDINVCFFFLM